MLNVAVPYEAPTLHSDRYNYPHSAEQIPSRRTSTAKRSNPAKRQSVDISDENEHYVTLAQPVPNAPPVIVFFSFMDKSSRRWALEHQVAHNIRRNVPQGTTVSRYHAPMRESWQLGDELTHAWAVADALNIDDKIIAPMFAAVQGKRVHDLEGIRQVFDECGIPPDMFLKEWGTPTVHNFKNTMERTVESLGLDIVPCILVGGKYGIKLDTYGDFNMEKVTELIVNLLKQS